MLDYDETGGRLAASLLSPQVIVWDPSTGDELWQLGGEDADVLASGAGFLGGDELLVAAFDPPRVQVYDLALPNQPFVSEPNLVQEAKSESGNPRPDDGCP